MICIKCASKPSTPQSGSCVHCSRSARFKLCIVCSRGLNQCEICRSFMSGYNPGAFFVRADESANGKSKKIKSGEELHITLDETPTPGSSTAAWILNSYP